MSQKNIYYRDVFQRRNKIKYWFFHIVEGTATIFRLFIEVFIRKDFGHRYFNFGVAFFAFLLLLVFPMVANGLDGGNADLWDLVKEDPLWYLYCAAFLYFSYRRKREIKTKPGLFDFSKFSLSTGKVLPLFNEFRFMGRQFTPRQREIYLEPLPFFIAGLILAWLGTALGIFFILTALLYSVSYMAAYYSGDHFLWDYIDEMHCNSDFRDMILYGRSKSDIPIYFDRPADMDIAHQLISSMNNPNDDEDDSSPAV